MAALPSYPRQAALPTPSRIVIADPPERDCKYYCFACDSDHEWYNLKGKGKNLSYEKTNKQTKQKTQTAYMNPHSQIVCLAAIATFSTQGIAAFDLRYPPNVLV